MRVRLAIGDFSRMTQLSIKTLRHYHEVGLLVPAEVDPGSGYRFYEPGQASTALVIRRFRDLGMPLEEIRQVLRSPDAVTRNDLITVHTRRMEARLADAQAAVGALRALLDRPQAPVTVRYRSVGPQRALAVTDEVPVTDLHGWWEAAFGELDAALTTGAATASGVRAALYSPEFFQLEVGQVIAYVPVAGGGHDAGRVRVVEIPAAELAIAEHTGSFDDLDRTYSALGVHVAEREIGLPGAIREHYVVSPFDTSEEASMLTEVAWPVFQTSPA